MATWKRILVEDDVAGDGIITVTSSASALHTVSLGDPAGLDELTSPVIDLSGTDDDKMLIWDEANSVWKWISVNNFPQIHLGNSDLVQTDLDRTFDIYNGGTLTFIANNSSYLAVKGEDGSGAHKSTVRIGNAIENFQDNNNGFGGIVVSSTSSSTGQDPRHYGLWIEGGVHDVNEKESPIKLFFERSYNTGSSNIPSNGDEIANIEFAAPYYAHPSPGWVGDNYGSEFEDGEGHIYGKITGGIFSRDSLGEGYLDFKLPKDVTLTGGVPSSEYATVLRVTKEGVRINPAETIDGTAGGEGDAVATSNDYILATDRGNVGQILHTDGLGGTYWEENIPSTYYNSSYGFINAELQSLLSYVNTTAFQQVQLDLAQTTTSGVDITEGYNISISTTDFVNADSVTFSGLDETMDNFSVTISGTIEWITQSSGYVQVWCEAVESDAGSNTRSLFNSQVPTYKQLILPQTAYQASSGGSAPIGGTSASFTYTVPQIGQINGQPVEDIVFKLYVQMLYGTGNHYFRLSELNISINN